MELGKAESKNRGVCAAELRPGAIRLHLLKVFEVSAELVTAAVAGLRGKVGLRMVYKQCLRSCFPQNLTMVSLNQKFSLPPVQIAVLM